MRRTLLVGQALQPTGMARVLCALARELSAHRDVHVLAIDGCEAGCEVGGEATTGHPVGYQLHRNLREWDPFGEQLLGQLAEELQPDSIVLYHDPWHIPRLHQSIRNVRSRIVAYCPIDGLILRKSVVADLKVLDALAVPTTFAAKVVIQCAAELGVENSSPLHRPIVLHHGVDPEFQLYGSPTSQFADRRESARRALFPEKQECWSGFWVLNVNRNHSRKKLDLTLRGFAQFAQDKPPDVRLYLRWGAETAGTDVRKLARTLGIAERLILPESLSLSTEDMNILYNAADVGVNTSTGEGWGLPAFEHAATYAAQILPNHSACAELWQDGAVLLPIHRKVSLAGVVEGGEIDPFDLAVALEKLYQDSAYREKMAFAARAVAASESFQWPRIASQWHEWLNTVEGVAVSPDS